MLVLSRRQGESISIGGDITLMVVKMGARRVKLAITAPPAVTICRGELRQTGGVPGRDHFRGMTVPSAAEAVIERNGG